MPFLLTLLVWLAPPDAQPLERVGRLDHPPIKEASGIVQSRRHPGIFWVHNDSGNAPALYAVRRDGTLLREYAVAIPNVDWEDITIDDDGHLYLGDIGNNFMILPLRAIYRVDEPDPEKPAAAPLPVTAASYYRTAKKEDRFDSEALFLLDGRAVVIAKRLDHREPTLYALRLDRPAPLTRPASPEPIGTLPGFLEPVTGADLSADGHRLAVCSYRVTRVYARRTNGSWSLIGETRYPNSTVEAICWDGDDLLLASEDRDLFRIPQARWQQGKATEAEGQKGRAGR